MKVLTDINEAYVPSIQAELEEYNASIPMADVFPPGSGTRRQLPSVEALVQEHIGSWVKSLLAKHGVLPPSVVVDGVPQEVTARQAYEELIEQGLHNDEDPALSEVEKCISLIADSALRTKVRNLWRKSTTFMRQQPELIMLWTAPVPVGLGKALPELDETFINASKR